jgi:hypothetical protein
VEKGAKEKEQVKQDADMQGYKESYPPNIRFVHDDEEDQFDRIKRTRRGRRWCSEDVS